MLNFDEILLELSYRVESGIVDLTKSEQVKILEEILTQNGVENPSEMAQKARVYFGYLNENISEEKNGQSSKYAGYFHRGGGYYSKTTDGEITHKSEKGSKSLKALPKSEKDRINKNFVKKEPGKVQSVPRTDLLSKAEKEKDTDQKEKKTYKESQVKAKEVSKKIYGENGKGALLQKSKTSDAAIKNGYVEGADWVSPGNAGSNFNENMSNEGCKILERYTDLDEQTLARVIFSKVKGSKLAEQQKQVAIGSADTIDIPEDITAEQKDLYKNCVIAARSARRKKDRADMGVQAAQKQIGFGAKTENKVYGGTKNDLANCEAELKGAKKIYVYDSELDRVIEIPKDVMVSWLKSGGGGENAADTIVLTHDNKGNIIYDGWSDKKTLKDIQGNSSLNDDYTKSLSRLAELKKSGRLKISDTDNQKATSVLEKHQNQIKTIEQGYKNISSIQSQYFLKSNNIVQIEKESMNDKNTAKHMKGWKNSVDAVMSGKAKADKKSMAIRNNLLPMKANELPVDYIQRFNVWAKKNKIKPGGYLKSLSLVSKNSPDALSGDDRKVIERTASREQKKFRDSGKKVPASLDTDEALSTLRKKSLDLQTKTFKELNKITAVNENGKRKKLGDILAYHDAKDLLHLDKIDLPENDEDYRQLLRRNTQLVLEGIDVTPKKLKECIGASSGKELEDNFELLFEERYQRDEASGRITGKVVYVYAFDKGGKKKRIAEKVYRPKQGQYAPTANTVSWSPDMQKCFDSKR